MVESNRRDFSELPEVKELEAILEKEEKRQYSQGKEDEHFAEFGLVVRWLDMLGLPSGVFKKETTWQEVLITSNGIQEDIFPKMKELIEKNDVGLNKLMGDITEYLGEEDVQEKADLIYVFGSKSMFRIEKAVELFKAGLASKIFITGGSPFYKENKESEASVFKKRAIGQGVSEENIITHTTAITIADNVRGGLNLLDANDIEYKSLILVNSWFAMRRSWAMMMKYISEDTKLIRVSAQVTEGGKFIKDGWWKNELGVKTIFNEFVKMRISELLNTS